MSEEERYQDCDGCGERFWGDDDIRKNLKTHVEGIGMLCDRCATQWEKKRPRRPLGTLYYCPVCKVVRHHVFIQEDRVQCRDGCMNALPYTYQGYLDCVAMLMEKTTTELGIEDLRMEKMGRYWRVVVKYDNPRQKGTAMNTALTLREALAMTLGAAPPKPS